MTGHDDQCRCGWAYTWDCQSAFRVRSQSCRAQKHWDDPDPGYPCPDCGETGVITDPEGRVVEDPCSTCWGLGCTDLPVPVPEHLQPPPRPF